MAPGGSGQNLKLYLIGGVAVAVIVIVAVLLLLYHPQPVIAPPAATSYPTTIPTTTAAVFTVPTTTAPRFRDTVRPLFEALYDSVESGKEANVVLTESKEPGFKEDLSGRLERCNWRT